MNKKNNDDTSWLDDLLTTYQRDGIDPDLFEAVRRGVYGRLVSGLDDPSTCGELALGNLLEGVGPLDELDALASLTAADVHAQLCRRLSADNATLSIVHPQ
jgi:predicted Zn-dependent peptidase